MTGQGWTSAKCAMGAGGVSLLCAACTLTSDSFERPALGESPDASSERAQVAPQVLLTGGGGASQLPESSGSADSNSERSRVTDLDEQSFESDEAAATAPVAEPNGLDAGLAETDGGLDASVEPDASPDASKPDASTPPASGVDAGPVEVDPDAGVVCGGQLFEGSCYEFVNETMSFVEAQARCALRGGHLPIVHSTTEDAVVGTWPPELGVVVGLGPGSWLGARDAVINNEFVWEDGSPFDFENFALTQPNDGPGVQCLEKRNRIGGGWADRGCGTSLRVVCEREL